MILPPGSILQHMHFIKQIRGRAPGYFMEIGPGNGLLSKILLKANWKGVGFEFDKTTASILRNETKKYLNNKQYTISNTDFVKSKSKKKQI